MQPDVPSSQILLIGFIVLVVLGGIFMSIAAKWAGVSTSLIKSTFTALLNFLASSVVFAFMGMLGASFFAFFVAVIVNLFIIRGLFKTDWVDAFKIWLGYITAVIISFGAIKLIG